MKLNLTSPIIALSPITTPPAKDVSKIVANLVLKYDRVVMEEIFGRIFDDLEHLGCEELLRVANQAKYMTQIAPGISAFLCQVISSCAMTKIRTYHHSNPSKN